MLPMPSSPDAQSRPSDPLALDCEAEVQRISNWMREQLAQTLKRRGVVVAISGGVDSAVCAALAVQALGPQRVFGLLLPELDSKPESTELGRAVAHQLGIAFEVQAIGEALQAIGCYRWRDEAIRHLVPDYGPDWKCKLAISGGQQGQINRFQLVVQSPTGNTRRVQLPWREYMQIVAATNYKQRLRKAVEYFHADRLHYAVLGTPNRLEYDQGFFVKNGDGAADLKPIAHIYKTQVYALARHLGLPEAVCCAEPSTDTFSLSQGQDEYYFALPHGQMDVALWAHNQGRPVRELAQRLSLSETQAGFIYDDIAAKRRATRYLHARPQLVEPVLQAEA
jgi:NAD+ synthase